MCDSGLSEATLLLCFCPWLYEKSHQLLFAGAINVQSMLHSVEFVFTAARSRKAVAAGASDGKKLVAVAALNTLHLFASIIAGEQKQNKSQHKKQSLLTMLRTTTHDVQIDKITRSLC